MYEYFLALLKCNNTVFFFGEKFENFEKSKLHRLFPSWLRVWLPEQHNPYRRK